MSGRAQTEKKYKTSENQFKIQITDNNDDTLSEEERE